MFRATTGSSLESAIYNELRRRIITLELKPGEMIYENAVAAEHGVSRTPARQAIARLTHEGLVTVLPQRGSMISRLSIKTLREAQFVREALELRAFTELAGLWDAQTTHAEVQTRAIKLVVQQKNAVANGDLVHFMELDIAFHNELIGALHNDILLDHLGHVRSHLTRLRYVELAEASHAADAIADHEALLTLLGQHDRERVATRLLQHLRRVEGQRDSILARHPELF